MSIFLDETTRILVQGITGKIGRVQTHWMQEYNTPIVGGVTPGKGGTTVEGVPVFDSVAEAVEETGANASVFLFRPLLSWTLFMKPWMRVSDSLLSFRSISLFMMS